MRIFLIILTFLLLCAMGFIYWKYFFVFSTGDREGLLNKFSNKGMMYKTYEGELLMPGMVAGAGQLSSNYFYFSVMDSSVAETLSDGIGKKVKVRYQQYNTALPWRGEDYDEKNSEKGQYIVVEAEIVK
jgi:hypothetical protein